MAYNIMATGAHGDMPHLHDEVQRLRDAVDRIHQMNDIATSAVAGVQSGDGTNEDSADEGEDSAGNDCEDSTADPDPLVKVDLEDADGDSLGISFP